MFKELGTDLLLSYVKDLLLGKPLKLNDLVPIQIFGSEQIMQVVKITAENEEKDVVAIITHKTLINLAEAPDINKSQNTK